jgi:DNA-binding LacI/PurR family transcriptional regulator
MKSGKIILQKYIEVKNNIKQLIETDQLEGKLPGERVLADRFGFSYMTIRHAINELVEEGYLYRVPRKGTFVSGPKVRGVETGNIGFYLYDRLKDGISSPYYSIVLKMIQKEVRARGYNLILFTRADDIDPKSVEGIIATSFPEAEDKILSMSKYLPIVLLDNDIKGAIIPAVVVDNFNSTYHAIEYAITLGHKNIGYVAGLQDSSIGLKRLAGFRTALQDYGVEIKEEFIYTGNYEFNSGYDSVEHFLALPTRPTFIHCANDLMALGLMKGLMEKGIKVPEEVSVIGFDNIEECERLHPSLTTMAVNFEKMANESVEILLAEIKGGKASTKKYIVPADLVIRESTAAYKK